MSRSFRTEKESSIARRRIQHDADGSVVLPRIISRKEYPGDVHPLSRRSLGRLLRTVPEEYLYGLSRIELRARESIDIGCPFGMYIGDEKAIFLYSLPLEWRLPSLSGWLERSLNEFFAETTTTGKEILVRWPNKNLLSLWFYCEVFAHELGHHFRNQYRHKRKRGDLIREELVADLHARRFKERLYEEFLRRSAE